MTETRQSRLDALMDEHPNERSAEDGELDASQRYALVETNRFHEDWISLHQTPDDACDYHFTQEYADDWSIVKLVDLDTGDEYEDVTIEAHFIGAPREDNAWMKRYRLITSLDRTGVFTEFSAPDDASAIEAGQRQAQGGHIVSLGEYNGHHFRPVDLPDRP